MESAIKIHKNASILTAKRDWPRGGLYFSGLVFFSVGFSLLYGGVSNESLLPTLIYELFCAGIVLKSGKLARTFQIELKKNHLLQSAAQIAFLIVWGLAFHQVFVRVPLVLSQFFVALTTQAVMDVHRGRSLRFSLAYLPMVLSLNFFLWFMPGFYWASLGLVLLGVLGKNLVRRRGESATHIFNPSGFAMGSAAWTLLFLFVSGVPHFYWDAPSTMYLIPHAAFFIAGFALLPQLFAGTLSITAGALGGFFLARHFLGMAFLDPPTFLAMSFFITDPVTSPRRPSAQFFYGLIYFAGVMMAEWLLGLLSAPIFFGKVLGLPFLNLTAGFFDRLPVRSGPGRRKTWIAAGLVFYLVVFVLCWKDITNPAFLKYPPFTVRHFMQTH